MTPQNWKAFGLMLTLAAQATAASPLTPEQALPAFAVADDLTVELVAAEPLTASPCAMAFDERGRLFVAENRGYPRGPGEGNPPVGSIALLEDTDGDGRMDKRTVFAEGLDFPNGVMPWKGGLLVTSAPDLLFLRDTDGDGRADERRVLLTGFETAKSTQLRVNAPLLGPDGWIWLASGLSGGKISNPERPELGTLDMKTDLRFDPETGKFEAVDGRSQYGHSFDDFGQRFICMNRLQVQHVVMPASALRRNPHLAFSDTVQNCPELVPNTLMRGGGGAARIFPISANITTADSHAGTFSAACAVTIWPGGGLPASYRGVAFSCDPTGNLVHADRLEPKGATFAAVSLFKDKEFLASKDDWFRPVFLGTGPDGALYVCDMYRKVIEHPDYLPQEVRKHTDFEAGKDMGRIWRVTRKGAPVPRVKFEEAAESLVARLGSENGWERQTAYRLLVERKKALDGNALLASLRKAAPSEAALLLDLLNQLGALNEEALAIAAKHSSAPVRAMALKFAPQKDAAVSLAQDADAHVRFQAALALGGGAADEAARALAGIALRDGSDRWARAAVLSSAVGMEEPLLRNLIEDPKADLALIQDLGQILGKQLKGERRDAVIEQFLKDAGNSPSTAIALAAGFAASPGGLPASPARDAVVKAALDLAANPKASPVRLLAIDLLGFTQFDTAGKALSSVLDSNDLDAQLAAVRAMARLPEADAAKTMIDPARWEKFPPAIRAAILNALGSRTQSIRVLLDAVESKALPVGTIDSLRRQQWTKHSDAAIRERANKLFAQPASEDRQRAFEEAKASLAMVPHPANGREVFRKLCASCHRIEREGFPVGPDLFDIRNQPKESILLHIVVPEHEIAPGFAAYVVEMKDGRVLSGVISSETTESLKLRQPGGQEETISRSGIATLTASPFSLMPPGLEKAMSMQELADLMSYLRGEQ